MDILLSISYIFMSSIPKNWQIMPHARSKIFIIKSHRDQIKSEYFFENLLISSFYFKEQSPRNKIWETNFCKILL